MSEPAVAGTPGNEDAPDATPAAAGPVPSLCLLADDEALRDSVEAAFEGIGQIRRLALSNVIGAENVLSKRGHEVVVGAAQYRAVLVEWQLDAAPIINTLAYHLRTIPRAPLIALCGAGADEAVAALAAGCDAAVPLPVHPPLVFGIALSYRRLVAAVSATPSSPEVPDPALPTSRSYGPLRIDRRSGRLYVFGNEVDLTPREYALLDFLISTPDRLFTREEILMKVWGINFDTGTNMVDVYMHFLRKKLEAHAASSMIQTVRGRGYRLALPRSR